MCRARVFDCDGVPLDEIPHSSATDLAFSGPATIRQMQDAWTDISAAIERGGALRLDVSGVTETDVSFVQLLESARATAAAQGGEVTLATPADGALRDVLERGGFLTDADAARLEFWTHAGAAQ